MVLWAWFAAAMPWARAGGSLRKCRRGPAMMLVVLLIYSRATTIPAYAWMLFAARMMVMRLWNMFRRSNARATSPVFQHLWAYMRHEGTEIVLHYHQLLDGSPECSPTAASPINCIFRRHVYSWFRRSCAISSGALLIRTRRHHANKRAVLIDYIDLVFSLSRYMPSKHMQ